MTVIFDFALILLTLAAGILVFNLTTLIVARSFGVGITTFDLFYSPIFKIARFTIKGVTVTLGWIPWGGSVGLKGMLYDKKQSAPTESDYISKSITQRTIISLFGPFACLFTGIALYSPWKEMSFESVGLNLLAILALIVYLALVLKVITKKVDQMLEQGVGVPAHLISLIILLPITGVFIYLLHQLTPFFGQLLQIHYDKLEYGAFPLNLTQVLAFFLNISALMSLISLLAGSAIIQDPKAVFSKSLSEKIVIVNWFLLLILTIYICFQLLF